MLPLTTFATLTQTYCGVFWDHVMHCCRALDIAKTHGVHLDTVVAHRQRFLESVGRKETDAQFITQAASVKVDWDVIKVCVCARALFERG